MKVLVIGLGSMGKRRIRLIKKYDNNIQIFGIDINKERMNICEKKYNVKTYNKLDNLPNLKEITCAFICTSPLSHSKIITRCLEHNINVFTELNLVSDGYERNIALAKERELVLFISSTFLYREEIKKIKSLVKEGECLVDYSYHVGQYLPDWHPWESYNDFFVGDKRTNACREIFAIELPWLTNVFGEIIKVQVIKNKISNLDIDYSDNYLLILQHNTGHKGLLAVDVVSRRSVRNLEVFGENLYLQWDGSPKGLKIFDYQKKIEKTIKLYNEIDQLENYSNFVVENAYFHEVISFFEAVNENTIPIYDFEKDKIILKIINEIEA